MRAARLWGAAAAIVGFTGLAACARAEPPTEQGPAPQVVAAPAPVTPVDHLAPGELVEGTEHAFGLTLPRNLHVDDSFADVIYATGDVGIHPLAKYFRTRLEGGSLREDDTSATFDHVRVPGRPERELHVRIGNAAGGKVRTEIRDSTPPPAPNLPDEAARWRAVGLTPQGKVLDPVHVD
jgi:hypothetical protein